MWQKVTSPYIKDNRLVVLGIIQEQHPDRAKLYRQWKQFDWPILVDSLNRYDVSAVPIAVAIDEEGIVRQTKFNPESYIHQFMKQSKSFDRSKVLPPIAVRQNVDQLSAHAQNVGTADAWKKLGDAYFDIGGNVGLDRAIDAYEMATKIDTKNGQSHFRLGVALKRRSETPFKKKGDAQAAIEKWGRALDINPNQYIWRRRIQQYGPRLDKPYNFYYWVDEARQEIAGRGERPIRLRVEPVGSEIQQPTKLVSNRGKTAHPNRDAKGRITRDQYQMVQIESTVTPARVKPGHWLRVQSNFQVNQKSMPYWNNEAKDLYVWVDVPNGFEMGEGNLMFTNPPRPETQEPRAIEFEIKVNKGLPTGAYKFPAYALYYVCQKRGGQCAYLRQDFTINVNVDENATPIK